MFKRDGFLLSPTLHGATAGALGVVGMERVLGALGYLPRTEGLRNNEVLVDELVSGVGLMCIAALVAYFALRKN